jgi:uncharacterized protein (DUF2235 family)
MAKNLVICSDGTNNSLQRDLTNVAHISRLATTDEREQYVYYDAGVGVDADPRVMTRIGASVSRFAGLAFGTGLVANVVDAYRAIVDHYGDGDRLYLFGFSRGAYTVRVLAGLLHHYGLLKPEHRDRAEAIVKDFRTLFPREGSADANDPQRKAAYLNRTFGDARKIKETYSRECPIHFIGIWDTVSSLGWAYDPKTFPNTARMPNAAIVRHALALDERRAKFRTNRVEPVDGQDLREVWFAGVHSDVGGGYPAAECGLSRIPLRWMLREARKAGLLVNDTYLATLALDEAGVATDESAAQHESLDRFWWGLEFLRLPHRRRDGDKWIDEKIRYRGKGWRSIRPTDRVSRSVERRSAKIPVKNGFWAAAMKQIAWED